ncbi:hypothetical protein FJ651_00235 [Paucihalobacter ruber]|uniref:Uncharacterized protein n=1 Tax=Paucihalobacter ruber TaxID=2567861 RepID=A0A506PNX3_9FLAO|nr:DUF6090 family protein [Paucihalobacter ruber]TPV35384.1 hypothetical protein FJ651_00235 [Paucihalobacter ruber]
MIKFFRHIRQTLIEQGKMGKPAGRTGRYFKYAIGEIVLVVIGILIALQINNWNERQNDLKVERIHMKNLVEDLKEDIKLYHEYRHRNGKIYGLIDSIVPNIKSEHRKEHVAKLAYWTRLVTLEWMVLEPVNRTYEEMKSSGQLRLIHDTDISKQLSKYYNSFSKFEILNNAGLSWAEQYVESLGKIFDAEVLMKVMLKQQIVIAQPNQMLTEDPVTINQLLNALNFFQGAIIRGDKQSLENEQNALKIIDQIETTYRLSRD